MRCALTWFSAIYQTVYSPGKEHIGSTYPTLSAKRPNSYKMSEGDFKKEMLPNPLSFPFQQKAGKGNGGGGEAILHQI